MNTSSFQSDADCGPFFKTQEQKGWLECWHAIIVTRNAIEDFVKTIVDQLYKKAVQNSPGCGPVAGITVVRHHICTMETEIIKYNFLKPPWKNADKSKWCSSPWEFAKCFIHAQGYKSKASFDEVDLNALLNIMRNCSVFQTYFSSVNVVDDVRVSSYP